MNIFICHAPFHYFLFKSIYANLPDSPFIIPPMYDKECVPEFGGGMSAQGIYDYVKNSLEAKNIKPVAYGTPNKNNFVNYLNDNAKNVIIPHSFDGIEELKGIKIIQMMYSMGLQGITAKNINHSYVYWDYLNYYFSDLILTYGEYSRDYLNSYGLNAIAIGNPLFDTWFKGDVSNPDIEILRKRIDIDKKTILYMPTWNVNSSIDKYYNSIIKLTEKHNVIIKLHHATFCGEANRLCKIFAAPRIIMASDYFSPGSLYAIADIILADGISGAVFDAMLVNKPLITIGASLEDYKISEIKKYKVDIPYITNPEELESTVEKAFANKKVVPDAMLDRLYYLRDGNSGKRAAYVIAQDNQGPSSSIERFDRGIKNSPNEIIKMEIIRKRDNFLRKNTKPAQKSMKQKVKDYIKSYLIHSN